MLMIRIAVPHSGSQLGPTNQRLVMHCLSEVTELPIRSNLEARLSQWLLFECDLTESSLLARFGAAEAFGRQSNLLDKILQAISLLLESERRGETTDSTIGNPEFVGFIYGSLLWRSFREQCSLYIGHDSCSFSQPSGLRMGSFEHSKTDQILGAVKKYRQLWNVHGHELWDSCKRDDVPSASI